jgi:hypothetical protein
MTNPHYAFRIWQILGDPTGETWGPILASASVKATTVVFDPDTYRRESWRTRTLVAKCRDHEHPAPQPSCGCGIYAYPDILDALQLIVSRDLCQESMYAFGLVSGYGGVHNDGSVIAHDACMRFAEADIVALGSLGSGYRSGAVDRIAAQLGVHVLSLNELQGIAEYGEHLSRQKEGNPAVRYLDQIAIGERVTVSRSTLMADRSGRLFVRNDRETWPDRKLGARGRFDVVRRSQQDFEVLADELDFPLLPFDGEADLHHPSSRLAGRVVQATLKYRPTDEPLVLAAAVGSSVQLPAGNRATLLDLMKVGERTPITLACVTFAKDGSAWLRRMLSARIASSDPTDTPHLLVERISDREFALDIQVDRDALLPYPAPYTPPTPTFAMDTRVTRMRLNGRDILGAKIPQAWVSGRSSERVITFGSALNQELVN